MGMFGRTSTTAPAKRGKYATKKIRERDRNAAESAEGRDIAAGWPGWGNRSRRARCRLSLRAFLKTYFASAFPLPFSRDHLRVIDALEHVLQHFPEVTYPIAFPSKGIGISASSRPFSEYERKPGDQVGHYWRVPAARTPRELRAVQFDSNYWKTLFHGRLAVAMGGRGCYSLFGDAHANHQLLGDHLSAEFRVETQGRGRTVWEWKQRPGKPDNHFLDCAVGCCAVGASMLGCSLPGMTEAQRARRQKHTWSEYANL
jgi:hypothetical protein